MAGPVILQSLPQIFFYSVISDNRCKDTLRNEVIADYNFWQLSNKSLSFLRFSLDYPKHSQMEHILANRFIFLRSNKLRHFFLRMVICIKTGCDVTDKLCRPVIQPQLGGGQTTALPKRLEIEPRVELNPTKLFL